LFARTNLVAWCIVPFDSKKRGPEERAAMLERLGFKLFAYDYRAEHIPTFDAEMDAIQNRGITLTAWWFPGDLNAEARLILDVLKRHKIKTQLWITGGGAATSTPEEQRARVIAESGRIRPIAEAAAKLGCSVGLYNHGSWFGEPDNQLEIIEQLKTEGATNVGIVYNQHHGHDHLDRFHALLQKIKPHLLALNLNGMTRSGDKIGKKILPLGQGDLDPGLLKVIRESGWRGPIGILNHTDEDAEARLLDNLDGLDWLLPQLDGHPPGPKPKPRSWHQP
jgi:sugar phosphate isomerase/epimerase